MAGNPPQVAARWKVGGVRTIHREGPDFKARTIRWRGTQTCTGGVQAIYLKGYSFLDRVNYNVWSLFGEGSNYRRAATGRVMRASTRGGVLEAGRRRAKRVHWRAVTEVPPPYQWVNDMPYGKLHGISRKRSRCKRYVASTFPAYLNGLTCLLHGYRFR